ncbi:hypothetical protein P154DRAFT_607067 [Amniculicola lignicola CBS 123094]|uniref:Uncharacterized protein n=1 Tax=Amniculicola lignicola CBS 123094 TaxID=1392246 RepID=A0A6A5W504_9PLEO|nr:hypothetical protein P154DRAFT_607067 [Amniculicola lignicola CBS 123094]
MTQAIHRSERICGRTKLIIFLGTPHRGSAYASWGQIASNMARLALQDSNKKVLEALEVNSEVLDNIHEEFKTIVFKGGIKIHSFQEARGISGMKGLDEKACLHASSEMAPNALFIVPFAKDDLFIGREDIIAEIGEKRAALCNHIRLALVGLGGIGKSQIAIEYAYRVQQAEPHTMVAWIHASNRTQFEQGYRGVADSVSLPGREDPKVDVLRLVCAWLSEKAHGRWLLILDNADDDAVFFGGDEDTVGTDVTTPKRPLESFLPQTPNGTILITSRNKTAAANLVGTHESIVQVEAMEEEDALALLKTRVPFDGSGEADAKALVQALDRIPLALFRESEANQVRLLGKKGLQDLRRDHSIRHAVISTWQISFTEIQRSEQPAADLLALMSMFDRQGIPMSLLRNSTSQLDFEDALAPLLSFSLVRAEKGEQSFGMHRLVQLSMRKWLEGEKQLSRWTKQSIGVLEAAFPSGGFKTWEDCQVILPHAREVFSHVAGDEEDVLKQAEVGLRTEWYLLLRGEYKAAEKVLGPEHPDTLTSIGQLGTILLMQCKYKEAEAMHRQALKGREKALGPEHPDTLSSMTSLASTFWYQRSLNEAEDLGMRAMETMKRVLEDEHPNTLMSMGTLKSQGRNTEAILLMETCVQLRERILGDRHPNTGSSLGKLTKWKMDNIVIGH